MDSQTGRVAFNLAILILMLAIIPLPILDPNSAEFTVDIMTIIICLAFILVIMWEVRRQAAYKKTPST